MARSGTLTLSDEKQQENEVSNDVIRTSIDRPQRKKRKPAGGTYSKLSVDIPKDMKDKYHYHWINDTPGRILQAQNGDYEFVSPQEVGLNEQNFGDLVRDSKVRVYAGVNDDGNPIFAYLMKIRIEWYKEDQAEMQEQVDRIDTAMRKGKLNDVPMGYIPEGGIQIRN